MSDSRRSQAKTLPYSHHSDFENDLRRFAAEWFESKKQPTQSRNPHVLENEKDWSPNIILSEVTNWIQIQVQQGLELHSDIHNGLSSQAMLFNLVAPLIVRKDLEPFLKALSDADIELPVGKISVQLEYDDPAVFNENPPGHPTSIDLTLHDESDENNRPFLFLESKLKEPGFAGCSRFEKHKCDGRNPAGNFSLCYFHSDRSRTYWELLKKHGFLYGTMKQSTLCVLSTHYQFFREVVFAVELGGTFVLLYDERNPSFGHDYLKMLLEYVPLELRDRVIFLHTQSLVAEIKASGRHEWIAEFERKYGLV